MPSRAESSDRRWLDDAVYTRDQAREGKRLYQEHCVTCHDRGYFRQVLRNREGQPLSELYNVMVALMPQNAPGTLSDAQYLDVIAYIIAEGRYRPGNRALRYADLDAIAIGSRDRQAE